MRWLKKIFGSNNSSLEYRILFTTDIHGSNVCFKKFINTINNSKLKPDALIIGGDITGKDLVYIVEQENGTFLTTDRGTTIILKNEEELKNHIKTVNDTGSYPYQCKTVEYEQLIEDIEAQDKLLRKLIEQRVTEWVVIADKKLKETKVPLIINTGNDDFYSIDKILKESKRMIFAEGNAITLPNGFTVLSCGYANKTPFGCPRDIEEDLLYKKIKKYVEEYLQNNKKMDSCIMNLHCPPINTKLDIGPKLKEVNKPVMTGFGVETDTVGSSAVRMIIEEYQPKIGLHGHIHESPNTDTIGNTFIVNPGSEYRAGILKFAIIDFFEDGKIISSIKTAM